MLGGVYWHPACFAALLFFFLLIVTIVEVHVLIFDVCVSKCCFSSNGFVHKMFLHFFIIACHMLYSNITTMKKIQG